MGRTALLELALTGQEVWSAKVAGVLLGSPAFQTSLRRQLMPTYVYRVAGEKLEVSHKMVHDPQTWGELCEVSGLDLGQRDPQEKVERLIVPVATSVSQFTADYKNSGFKRLERRDSGVYEETTAPKGERIIDSN